MIKSKCCNDAVFSFENKGRKKFICKSCGLGQPQINEKKMECVICEKEIDEAWEEHVASGCKDSSFYRGHNAMPVSEGRCCSECNFKVVLPERLKLFFENQEKDDNR